ncbi:hypothetical protein B0T24DRAFT_681890 [Lasiosphaeria ovina]|uniref:Uncharacterized protein n=1 Tax=Lasiosphaeria ovina TaxID=92902 RepID=A0AAE0N0U1_9PEZI|nr:hypothetical protein B0T24DRAFT_681890 [Lasiosphaeria ovina]
MNLVSYQGAGRGSTVDNLYEAGNDEITSNFPFGASQYWPETLIQQLVQDLSVHRTLSESDEKYEQELVGYILRDAKKLFAIAAATEADCKWMLYVMRFFKENGFKDSELLAEFGAKCLWRVLVPVISTEKDSYDFSDRAILPFNKIRTINGCGAGSVVSEVSIREGHSKDSRPVSEWPKTFAVKQIVPPDVVERQRIINSWLNETGTLRRMNLGNNEHILRFITAFTWVTSVLKSHTF